MPYKQGFGPFAGEIYRVPMAYPYRWPTGADRCADEAFDAFVSQVHTQVREQNTAAVIIEPIQGEGGFIVPPTGYLRRVADWCTQNGIRFIADEIQSGFCRTGNLFACEHEDVVPDLITTAKGIAGGRPLAAVTGRADVMDSVHGGGLGGTYGGNPVACAAALSVGRARRRTCPRSNDLAFGESESGRERHGGWSGEVVALSESPSLAAQDVGLHFGFDSFRDARQMHTVDQSAQPLGECVGLGVAGGEVAHESQIELDPGHGQVP